MVSRRPLRAIKHNWRGKMGLFSKKAADVPIATTDELARYRKSENILRRLTGALLFPYQSDRESPCDEADFFKLKQEFFDKRIVAEGCAEYGDSYHGDFYMCQDDKRRRVTAAFGSASGKDSSGALLGAYLRGYLDNWFLKTRPDDPSRELEALCSNLNEIGIDRAMPGKFISLAVLVLDSVTGQVWVSSRGSSKIPVVHQNGSIAIIRLENKPALWTISEDFLAMRETKDVRTFKLSKGDTLFLGNGPFDDIPGTDDAGPDFLLSMLKAVNSRGILKIPAKEGTERPPLDLSALPGEMDLSERMVVALLALRLHDLAYRRTQADTEERLHAETLYIRRSHAEILGLMFPGLETERHTGNVSKLPIEIYGGFKSPVAMTLRYTGAPG